MHERSRGISDFGTFSEKFNVGKCGVESMGLRGCEKSSRRVQEAANVRGQ